LVVDRFLTMARLSDDIINRIKTEVDLLSLVASQGFKPKPHGNDKAIPCPFHQDDTASCIITPTSNLFHCFGCGAAGSVIDWVMKTQSVSFRFACELLQKDLGALTDVHVVKRDRAKVIDNPLAANADSQQALQQVIDYYHQTLKQSPEVLDYLKQRGLDDPALIDHFKLGYANRTLGYRLPNKQHKAGAEIRGQLQEIGILRKTGHEHFNGSLVVPVIDENGCVTEVYGRKINGKILHKECARHLYLPGAHRGVWNAQGLAGQKQVILCEALIDAMTFWANGFKEVTASYGTQGFTADHLTLFKQLGIETVLIAYDNDDAGNQAADKLAPQLSGEGFNLFRVTLPKDMDVNGYALHIAAHVSPDDKPLPHGITPVAKALSQLIRQALWQGEREPHDQNPSYVAWVLAGQPGDAPAEVPPVADPSAAASPLPESPTQSIPADITEQEVTITLAERSYRIRGLERNTGLEQLKINLLAKQGEAFHVDTLDLYSSKARLSFIKQAALELGANAQLIKADLGKVLLKLEDIQAGQLQAALATKNEVLVLSPEETFDAMALLTNPDFLSRIVDDFEACGVVGERVNTLTGYLACVSRKLARPLAVMIQSSSAAGKSSLMDAVLNFMPEEARTQYSAMTSQSLFYMGETNLKHNILAIAEEEGADNASYALKLLQSEGEVTIASTGKNAITGNMETQEYRVEGPVMLFMTTTAIDIDEELLNRCLVLTVNESQAQTQAIHQLQRQRRTLDGLLAKVAKDKRVTLHQNAQRLLKKLAVVNPFADKLSFLDNQTRTRRDHEKYLTLIDSIALLHQHQRPVKTVQDIEYIEVTLDDIAVANALASDVLGRTLDELPPQTRTLLTLIHKMVQRDCVNLQTDQRDIRFSRRQIREFTDWGNTQLKIHCQRLEDMEYLIIHRGGRGVALMYELAWQGEGDQNQPFMMGLNSLTTLGYDAKRSGVSKLLSGLGAKGSPSSRGQVGPKSVGCRTDETPPQASKNKASGANGRAMPENVLIEAKKNGQSCRSVGGGHGNTIVLAGGEA
jgi:DNA primase